MKSTLETGKYRGRCFPFELLVEQDARPNQSQATEDEQNGEHHRIADINSEARVA